MKQFLISFLLLLFLPLSAVGSTDRIPHTELYELNGVIFKKFTSDPFEGMAFKEGKGGFWKCSIIPKANGME